MLCFAAIPYERKIVIQIEHDKLFRVFICIYASLLKRDLRAQDEIALSRLRNSVLHNKQV